jgi:exodeoxyribonuclease VII small subunit
MKKTQTFEQAMHELEQIVNTLDEGELSLDEMLKQFEQGMKLSQLCQQTLVDAQKKFDDLTRGNNDDKDSRPDHG